MQHGEEPEERYGVTNYRTIHPWVYATLHVKVVEARGLMARDGVLRRSDPYVNLNLSGRYLSNGQEWSKKFQISEQTKVVKYSLNPVWNESFSLPVRRAGAFLRVELWDWDRGSSDDPLGSFEVKIGEELLSQKAMDMWFVLDAPRDWKKSSSSPSKSGLKTVWKKEQEQPSEVEEENAKEEETAERMAAGSTTSSVLPPSWSPNLGKRFKRKSHGSNQGGGNEPIVEGSVSPGEDSDVSEASIQYRRDHFGEVRLELRFEFNGFGETCSHLWPEERPRPVDATFSPNRVYYNALLLQQLAQPYFSCIKEAGATVHWVRPWKSLLWFMALVVLLLHPCLLIVVINVALAGSVLAAYLEYTFPPVQEADGGEEPSSNTGRIWRRRRRRRISKRSFKMPQKSLLPPIDEPGDEKLEAMYRTVRKTKKLPVVVEEIGRRNFAEDGLPAQRQVEEIGTILMTVRRLLRPVKLRSVVLAIIALCAHTVLQLWLYRTSRFHLYLVGCCCGVFAFNFYAWRGRAFIAGVKEAVRCRQLRRSLANTDSSSVSGTASSERSPLAEGLARQTSGEQLDLESAPGAPAFAPPGATPASDTSSSLIERFAQRNLGRDLGRGRCTRPASRAATSTTARENDRTGSSTAKNIENHGAQKTPPGMAKQKRVRFEDGTVGPLLPGLVATTQESSPAERKPPKSPQGGRDLWKLGKEKRTWKGTPTSGTPTYGSIDDVSSDEEGGNWDEETGGGAPAKRGILTTARWSFHGDEGGGLSKPGGDGGGGDGAQSNALLAQVDENDDSPRGRHGWRGRVTKWYHDL
eukprot:g9177.t1